MSTALLETVCGGMGNHPGPRPPSTQPPATPRTPSTPAPNTALGDMCREAYTGLGAAIGAGVGAGGAGIGAVPGAIIGGVLGAGAGALFCQP